jgi:hypothetical protein
MAKTKTKTPAVKIPESKLIKALAELQGAIEKGDALEDADPEGGLSTEGEPLSTAAPSGKGGGTRKSQRSSSSSSSVEKAESSSSSSGSSSDDDDDEDASKAMSASDFGSDDDEDEKKSKKKDKGKKKPPPFIKKAAESCSSDSESSDDDGSTEKSFGETATQDETIAKAIDVSDFLKSLVDQLSLSDIEIAKSLVRLEQRISAKLDAVAASFAKSFERQAGFNARSAQALAAIGNIVQDNVDVTKSLANSPAPAPRGKAVLSKGEVNNPPWGNGGGNQMAAGSEGDFIAEASELTPEAVGDWLFKKSAANQIDPRMIMAWEADRYSVETLPVQIRKALVNDLCK